MSKEMTSKDIKTKFNTLYVLPEVIKKINYYAQAADGEVSGLGTIITDDTKRLIVDRVFLLEQESSTGDTELDSEAVSKLLMDMIKEKDDPGKIKFWWHSHGNMGVFWSSTDDECAEQLSKEFAFSLVVNKEGEMRCRLDLYNPFRITVDGIKIREITIEDEILKKACKEEVKEKVRSSTPVHNCGNWRERGGYGPYFPGNNYLGGKLDLKDHEVEDVIRLLDLMETNIERGGVFLTDTWDEYIQETLREVCRAKFDGKSSCTQFGTWGKDFAACTCCRVNKKCQYYTELWEKEDEEKEIEMDGRQDVDLSREEIAALTELEGEEEFSKEALKKEENKK